MKIDQHSSFLLGLMDDVLDGRVLPAAMQRPYVWSRQDVEALCDSIISGFPIGGFLFWLPDHRTQKTGLAKQRLGPISANTIAHGESPLLLLDGQNRLTTIAWMAQQQQTSLFDELSTCEKVTWANGQVLVLDGVTRSMRFVPGAESKIGLKLPAWTVLETSKRMGAISANSFIRGRYKDWKENYSEAEIESFEKLFDDVSSSFRNARITSTVIMNATPEEARHAFLRICKVGVPMSENDFDNALNWVSDSTKVKMPKIF